MNGIHCTADVQACRYQNRLEQEPEIWNKWVCAQINDVGLHLVGKTHHQFTHPNGTPAGCTYTWLLAESHVNMHTWPEKNAVTLDIYVCNYSEDNTQKARTLLQRFLDYLGASSAYVQQIERGTQSWYWDTMGPNSGNWYNAKKLWDYHSSYHHIEILDCSDLGKMLRLNGIVMCTERDEALYHEPIVHAPILNTEQPKKVLILGGGDGGAAREVLKHPVELVRLVELDFSVIDASKKHLVSIHQQCWNDPRMDVVIDDAMHYTRHTNHEKYDSIIMDLTDPDPNSIPLYNVSYLAHLLQDCLNDGGCISLHIGSPIFETSRIKSMLETLRQLPYPFRVLQQTVPTYGGVWCTAIIKKGSFEVVSQDRICSIPEQKTLSVNGWKNWTALPRYIESLLQPEEFW